MPENRSKSFWIVYGYLFLIVLLRLIPLFNPESRTWGFDHLAFLSRPYLTGFFVLCGIALIFPFIDRRLALGAKLTGLFANFFYEHRLAGYYRLIIVVPAFLIFLFLPQTTHFLGDGYEAIEILSRSNPFFLKFSQTGALWFYETARALIGPETKKTAELTFRIVPALCGALYVYLAFMIAGIATEDKLKRVLIWVTAVFSGILLMFFGYAEFYAPVVVLSLLYLYFGLQWIKRGRWLIWAIAIFLAGLFFHLIFMFYIPSLLVIIFSNGDGRAFYKRYKKAIYITLSCIVIAGIIGFVHFYTTNLVFENMFLPLFSGKPVAPDYGIFTPHHLLDIFNEFMLVAPMALIFLVVGIGGYGAVKKDGGLLFLTIAAAGFVPFLFAVDPQLSMARDWDLFSMTLIPFIILSVPVIPQRKIGNFKNLVISILILCLLFSASFLKVQLDRKESVTYFENLIDMNPRKSISSLAVLSNYYKSRGLNSRVDSLRIVYRERFPNYFLITEILDQLVAGNVARVQELIPRVRPDKFDADYHRMKADVYSLTGRRNEAVEEMNLALQLRPRAPLYYYDRARIYFGLREMDKARSDLYTGYGMDPESGIFYDGLSYYYMAVHNYDSTLKYARLWRESNTAKPYPLYYLAKAYILNGNRERGRLYYDSLMMFPLDDSRINEKRNEIRNMLGDEKKSR